MFPAIYRSVIHSAVFMIRASAISYVVIYQCEYLSNLLYFMFLWEWRKLSFFSLTYWESLWPRFELVSPRTPCLLSWKVYINKHLVL